MEGYQNLQLMPNTSESNLKTADQYIVEAARSAMENLIISPSTKEKLDFNVDDRNAAVVISSKK